MGMLFRQLGIPKDASRGKSPGPKAGYWFERSQDPAFFGDLLAADIFYAGRRVGVFGVVHPEVVTAFGIKIPCAACELDIEPFL